MCFSYTYVIWYYFLNCFELNVILKDKLKIKQFRFYTDSVFFPMF